LKIKFKKSECYLHTWHGKKNDTSLPRRRFCWLNGVNPEESSFFKGGIYFFFYRG